MSAKRMREALQVVSWIALAGIVLGVDYLTGPTIRFPIAFLVPVMVSAWVSGSVWGVVLALALPLLRLGFALRWEVALPLPIELTNAAIQIVVLAALAVFVSRTAMLLNEVKTLRGIVPMCSLCKKIRSEDQTWIPLETYISTHTEAQVSHGLCPSCYKKFYGEADGT